MREESTGLQQAYVRMPEIRIGGQPAIELIMPLDAFEEFCHHQDASLVAPDDDAAQPVP
jgi:hypothetical protein